MAKSSFFNGSLYQRMSEDLHLTGKGQRTHDGYLREIRKLADYCQTSPDQINEDQLRRYFLHLKNEKHYAEGSLRVSLSAFKFFFIDKLEYGCLVEVMLEQQRHLVQFPPGGSFILAACHGESAVAAQAALMGLRRQELVF